MTIRATEPILVRYWHSRKGGWRHGLLLKQGRKWAVVAELAKPHAHRRVPVENIKPPVEEK